MGALSVASGHSAHIKKVSKCEDLRRKGEEEKGEERAGE